MVGMLTRGLFHICGGLFFPVVALFLPRIGLLIFLGVVTFVFLAFDLIRFKVPAIKRLVFWIFKPLMREKEASSLTGASYLLVASLIVFVVFTRDIAVLSLCFLAVGDAVAGIVGKKMGKRRLLSKTLEGDMACFISCVLMGSVLHYAVIDVPLLTILVGSASAAIIEAIPLRINDNLTMPLFAGLMMTIMQL